MLHFFFGQIPGDKPGIFNQALQHSKGGNVVFSCDLFLASDGIDPHRNRVLIEILRVGAGVVQSLETLAKAGDQLIMDRAVTMLLDLVYESWLQGMANNLLAN